MMNIVTPVWDGNETWLVLGGAALFAAFPMVYATVLSALYFLLVLMLVCLIFRDVSFEIRAKAQRTKHMWDLAFIGGSAGATFFQSVTLGAFLEGIPVTDGRFASDAFGWFSPFSIFTGVALVVTYALIGACWLIAKTEGDLQRRIYRVVWPLTVLQLATILVVSVWTLLQDAGIAARWFDSPWFDRMLPPRCWSPRSSGRCAARLHRGTKSGRSRWRWASRCSAIWGSSRAFRRTTFSRACRCGMRRHRARASCSRLSGRR